jgi:CRP-like cAMP-binding protein
MAVNTDAGQARARRFRRHEHLARQGEAADRVYFIEEGWACQYRLLADGRRQIIGLYLPGEHCEPQWALGADPTCPVIALTEVVAREIPLDAIRALPAQDRDSMANMIGAILRILRDNEKWIVNLGRLTATERICNLLTTLFERLQASGRVQHDRGPMPLTQYDLADIAGISPIHVNRVLQMLRSEGVIELKARRLALLDRAALEALGGPLRK